jgi:DNA-binding NtrC family response regulator
VRIGLVASGESATSSVTLEGDGLALVGRDPDPRRLAPGTLPPGAEAPESIGVRAPNVSRNHLIVARDGATVRLRDLGSRNGSWVRLPPLVEVSLPAHEELSLFLGTPGAPEAAEGGPADASWHGRADFEAALVTRIEDWLSARGISAQVIVSQPLTMESDVIGRMPLAVGSDLFVAPTRTTDDRWLSAITQIERYVARQNALFDAEETMREEGLIVASQAMRKAIARLVDVAARGSKSLLLIGPSGSGKEGMARCFHRHSGRAGPFVAKNCATLTRDFVRSELFGAEKGAFTGAVQRTVGAVENAHEGTLFLDEIGELPLDVQPMLLRFLDQGEYERLGHRGPLGRADVCVVGATNKDLREATLRGEFRRDLWFRLCTHIVEVPPLNERFDDVEAYLKTRRLDRGQTLFDALTPGAREVLKQHEWEGNFRELINFANRVELGGEREFIDEAAATSALAEGALQGGRRPSTSDGPSGVRKDDASWRSLGETAAAAFVEDLGVPAPRSWDEVKHFVESYFKPLLLAHLTGVDQQRREEVEVRLVAERLNADRGTASKQIARYFDRFRFGR